MEQDSCSVVLTLYFFVRYSSMSFSTSCFGLRPVLLAVFSLLLGSTNGTSDGQPGGLFVHICLTKHDQHNNITCMSNLKLHAA